MTGGDHSTTAANRTDLARIILERVGEVIVSVNEATHVDQVIVALFSLAASLFPLHADSFSGSVDERFRDELSDVKILCEDDRIEWMNAFYTGSAFRAFSRVLLYDVCSNWLSCFPTSARRQLYDVFFLNGRAVEIIQVVIPCLQHMGTGGHNSNTVYSNVERLVILLLLENNGILQIVKDFSDGHYFEDLNQEQLRQTVSKVAQLVTSVPDKVRQGAPTSLSPHFFFNTITTQLLHEALKQGNNWVRKSICIQKNAALLFVGATFSRLCRRGFTDLLLSNTIPLILKNVQDVLSSSSDLPINEIFESNPGIYLWLNVMEAFNDSHAVERIAEGLMHSLVTQNVNDVEGYWILWLLFGRLSRQNTIRSTFSEKFILWKVFPIRCLKWILHFSVLECPPDNASVTKSCNTGCLLDTIQHLVVAWSKNEFVQSATTEQQAYVTSALGICLENMTKEDLDDTKDVLPSILHGISCRLESPDYLIRKMASSIAFVFSKVIDPKNPLSLDECFQEETIDWEIVLATPMKCTSTSHSVHKMSNDKERLCLAVADDEIQNNEEKKDCSTSKSRKKEFGSDLCDPDEVIDPVSLNNDSVISKDDSDCESENSEASNESLIPYDLTDDGSDLTRNLTQLVDIVGALRKSDDAEGVEKALNISENLVRASSDELKYIAGDLAKTLVHVRCSDFTVEGEEASAEEKRQKILVALIVTCPTETVDSLNKLLCSSNLDISQRIMVLDVMTDAVQELASTRILRSQLPKTLILPTSDHPWFVPRDVYALGAGPWKKIPSSGTPLNWFYSFERELPSKAGQIKKGKTKRWSIRSPILDRQTEYTQNNFPQYAAAFMLPVMQQFDKKGHGIDLLGRDFIVLGKLIHMLGVCMKCAAMHPEASMLASPLLDMLRTREISHHREAYVRRSVLFTASSILLALHPSFVASAVIDGNIAFSEGLEWVRAWSLQVAETDTDRDCHRLAMQCLQHHAEMVLRASHAFDSTKDDSNINISPPNITKGSIKLPF